MSKKMPGMTMHFSFKSSSKKVYEGVSQQDAWPYRRFGTHKAVVEGGGQMFEVQPYVESRLRRNRDLQAKASESFEDMVALVLEVPLQGNLFLVRMFRVQQRDSSKLEPAYRWSALGVEYSGRTARLTDG